MKLEDVKVKYEVTNTDHDMTRRDHFACAAMQFMADISGAEERIAKRAYAIADALEKARVQK